MRKYKQLIFLSNSLFYSLLAKSGLLFTIQFYWHTAICVHAFTYTLFYACFFTIKAESLVVGTDTIWSAAAAAKSLQSCPTLCDPRDGSPPGFSVHGILQAKTLEWVAISFSNAWKWKVKVKLLSRVWLLATPWTAAYQALPSMGFSGQQYWSGVPLPSPTIWPTKPKSKYWFLFFREKFRWLLIWLFFFLPVRISDINI